MNLVERPFLPFLKRRRDEVHRPCGGGHRGHGGLVCRRDRPSGGTCRQRPSAGSRSPVAWVFCPRPSERIILYIPNGSAIYDMTSSLGTPRSGPAVSFLGGPSTTSSATSSPVGLELLFQQGGQQWRGGLRTCHAQRTAPNWADQSSTRTRVLC